jgi:hypothetical protein
MINFGVNFSRFAHGFNRKRVQKWSKMVNFVVFGVKNHSFSGQKVSPILGSFSGRFLGSILGQKKGGQNHSFSGSKNGSKMVKNDQNPDSGSKITHFGHFLRSEFGVSLAGVEI